MALREQKQTLKAKSEQLQQEITNLNQRIENVTKQSKIKHVMFKLMDKAQQC